MKIKEQNSGLLTNAEVVKVLRSRGADGSQMLGRALASEKMVYQSLTMHKGSRVDEPQLKGFLTTVEPYKLTKAEALQLLNLAPTSVVEIHLVVEECEERLNEQQMEEVLELCQQHLVPSAAS